MRRILIPLLLLLLPLPAVGRDIHVPQDLPGLAEALDYALSGDRIILAPGHYHVRNVALVDGVTVVGDPEDPGAVVLNAQQYARVLSAENLSEVTLRGLTLTGGRADGEISYRQSGGALLVSDSRVLLERVHVLGNLAVGHGGGVQVLWGDVEAVDCVFRDNQAGDGGGAVDLRADSRGRFTRCRFEDNRAAWGGGVSSRAGSQCQFTDSWLLDNAATEPQEIGGAFFADYSAFITFNGSVLADNAAREGGAVRLADALATFASCTIVDNGATEDGGAMMVRGGSLMLSNSIIAFNAGAAVAGDLAQIYVSGTDIHGNAGGDWIGQLADLRERNDNFDADPLFCETNDYHLTEDSPCAPENHPRGLIGALPVDCGDVAIELLAFEAEVHAAEVYLTWQVQADQPYEYRLRGHFPSEPDAPDWDVPYRADIEPGSYLAVDKARAADGLVAYTLDARADGGAWFQLGQLELNPTSRIAPDALRVSRVFPNPFNPRVKVEFSLPEAAHVEAVIYDLQGRRVRTLVSGPLPAGQHALRWDSRDEDGRRQPTGTYLLRLSDGVSQRTTKLLLVK